MTGTIKALGGGIVGLASHVLGGKKSAAPQQAASPLPVATRDDAAAAEANADALRRRRGTAANMLLGPSGAEAGSGTTATKMLTGQ